MSDGELNSFSPSFHDRDDQNHGPISTNDRSKIGGQDKSIAQLILANDRLVAV